MERFVVCYSRLDGEMIQSRSESFANIADAAVQFNKWAIDMSLGFSIMLVDTKANVVLQHYVHNRYSKRDVFLHNEDGSSENEENAEDDKERGFPPPDEYKGY